MSQFPTKVRQVIAAAAGGSELRVADILGPSRERNIVRARRRAVRDLLDLNYSSAQVGRYLGINHTSVLYHGRRSRGLPGRKVAWGEVPCPDLSGEWAI